MDKFGLSEHTIATVNNYFKTVKEIEKVEIFGSRAKGTFKTGSDIDFVIYGNDLTDKLIRRISNELDELPTPYKFDILCFASIDNEDLIKNIKKDGKLFYKNASLL